MFPSGMEGACARGVSGMVNHTPPPSWKVFLLARVPGHPTQSLCPEVGLGWDPVGKEGLWGLEQTGFGASQFGDWKSVKVESPLLSPDSSVNPLFRGWAQPDYCHLVNLPASG